MTHRANLENCVAQQQKQDASLYASMDLDDLRNRSDLLSNCATKKEVRRILQEKMDAKVERRTKEILLSQERKREILLKRSKNFINSEASPSTILKTNDKITYYGNSSSNIPRYPDDHVDATVHQLLKRPVLIDDFTLALNTIVVRSFNPWDIWSKDNFVRSKLRNYAFFHATMCLRFTVSSSKYHFGNLMLSYQPYSGINQSLISLEGLSTAFGPKLLNNYLSQSPERSILSIGVDNTLEMRLPLLIPKENIRLFNRGNVVIPDNGSYDEFVPLGEIYMTTINLIKSANLDLDQPVKIQTYAWVEDLHLSGSTATDVDITSEAQPLDEYDPKKGSPLSSTFTAISNIAEKLTDIPYIGVAARATSMASATASSILKLFGYSKPAQIADVLYAKTVISDNMANSSGFSTAYKITLDPKQELSLQVMGGDSDLDPMSFKFLTSRESYLDSFDWGVLNVPRVTDLFQLPITPNLCTVANLVNLQPTSLAFASSFFDEWRGTISFRFEVVASSFHRGKLMFIYEPNGSAYSLIKGDATNVNEQYIYYLDIEESRNITIHCGFLSDRLFALTHDRVNLGSDKYAVNNYLSGVNFTNLYNSGVSIGNLYVRPFTALIGPDPSSSVSVNVYVYSNDIELATPCEINNPTHVLSESQPVDTRQIGQQNDSIDNGTFNSTSTMLNNTSLDNKNIYLYHYGEKIESFRSLLKRNIITNVGLLTLKSDLDPILGLNVPMFPCCKRDQSPAFTSLDNANPITLRDGGVSHIFNELRLAYLFMKGGIRHKIAITLDQDDDKDIMYTATINRSRGLFSGQTSSYEWSETTHDMFRDDISPRGGMLFDTRLNGIIDVEIPYYSSNLFELSCKTYSTTVDRTNGIFRIDNPFLTVFLHNLKFTFADTFIRSFRDYTSIAEDFTFFRFQGAPPYST